MNPTLHKRKQLRLRDYHYATPGMYFVTMCTQDRRCLFGEVVGAGPCAGPLRPGGERAHPQMVLNDAGQMIQSVWEEIPDHYCGVCVDAFVVMPNHIHGIIALPGTDGRPRGAAPTLALFDVVQRVKSLTTTRYIRGIKQRGWPPFQNRLWQRNYYDHIIRNDEDLNRVREYIIQNPLRWDLDPENVGAQSPRPMR